MPASKEDDKIPTEVREAIKVFASLGGKARAASLTPEQRKAIAVKAARARWAKHEPPKEVEPADPET